MVLRREVPLKPCESTAASSYALSTGSNLPWYGPMNGAFVYAEPQEPPPPGKLKLSTEFTTVPQISSQDGAAKTLLIGEFNYGLSNYTFANHPKAECRKIKTPAWGTASWAVGYPGYSWGSTVGIFNSNRLINGNNEWVTYRSDHGGGAQFAMVDGSVHFLADTIDAALLNSLATRHGRETIMAGF